MRCTCGVGYNCRPRGSILVRVTSPPTRAPASPWRRSLVSRTPSPILRRRRLGSELRSRREAAGLTGDQVVSRIGWASASKLSRLENGRSRPDLGDVLDLLDLYGVSGAARDDLIAIARDAAN